jgi:predicted CoA-binding protein
MAATSKKTLVLGASPNPNRYSNLAIQRLRNLKHPVVGIGKRVGKVADIQIDVDHPPIEAIDTITLYLNASNQKAYYDYIMSLHPKRIFFNPGAENEELNQMAAKKGIETLEACTLVLLSTGQY